MRRLDRLVERARRMPPLGVDGALAAGIFALNLLGPFPPPLTPGLGLQALACIGVALRRKSLWTACLLVVLAHLGGVYVDVGFIPLPLMVLLFTVSEFRGLATSIIALIVSCWLPFASFRHCCLDHGWAQGLPEWAESIYPYLILVWFAGRSQAESHDISCQLESGLAQLHEERQRLSRAAVEAERSRIARDLHGLVIRGVERMKAATREALDLLHTDPGGCSGTVGVIESTGRATLVEMRRLLSVLRTGEDTGMPPPDVIQGSARSDLATSGDVHFANTVLAAIDRPSPGRSPSESVRRWIATPWGVDALLVLVLAVLTAAEPVLAPSDLRPMPFLPLKPIALGLLLFRRREPLAVLAAVTVVVFAGNWMPGAGWTVERSMFVAVFTVAAFRGRWWGLVGVGARLIAHLPWQGLQGATVLALVQDLLFWTWVYLIVVAGGVAVRNARRLNAELEDQTELLRRTKEERIRLAVAEERTRVARDLHDVVAHALTIMVVQAGAARALAAKRPEQAYEALGAVEHMGRDAMAELDSLFGHLGLAGIDAADSVHECDDNSVVSLVNRVMDDGLKVELLTEGHPGPRDAGLELAVYRIVQEALTNVRKHAPGARAWVVIRYSRDDVEIEVTDTGASTDASSSPVPGAHLGLVGIAERAALFGGEMEAGPIPEGGFRVRARLQTESVLV